MDLQKAKILLKKINALNKSMGADPEHISTIEKDLILSYIRQLYEIFLEQVSVPKATSGPKLEIIDPSPKPKPEKEAPQKTVAPALEISQIEKKNEPPVSAKPYKPPRIIDLSDSLKEITEPETVSATKPQTLTAKPKVDDEELESLFQAPKAKELSEKLGELPIKDLKKAMGINEKMFTINELFGGEQAVYDAVISTLNQLDNFEQAKGYLIDNVAVKYKWTAKGKKKKAMNFIKLVRRRYN